MSTKEVFLNDNDTVMYHKLGTGDPTLKSATFTLLPGAVLIVDLGEVENTKPAPLPLPPVRFSHGNAVEREEIHRTIQPDNALHVFYRLTNRGGKTEIVEVGEDL